MEDRIRLIIITPAGTALERNVNYVNLPMPDGSVGVLPGHAPMFCALGKGKLKCRSGEGETLIAVSGGVARVENNELTVLTEEAQIGE